jgi:hypothetical protein
MKRLSTGYTMLVFDKKNHNASRLAPFLKIYTDGLPSERRTKTNELVAFLPEPPDERSIAYLGLCRDGRPIGFAVFMYYDYEKYAIVDHLIVSEKDRSISAFFSFCELINDYINQIGVELEHLVSEVFIDDEFDKFTQKSLVLTRLLRVVGFKVARIEYWSPDPIISKSLSDARALLLLASKPERKSIASDDLNRLVTHIYQKHAYGWYQKTLKTDAYENYKNLCDKQLNVMNKFLQNSKNITLNGAPKIDIPFTRFRTSVERANTGLFSILMILPPIISTVVAFVQEWKAAAATSAVVTLVLALLFTTGKGSDLLKRFFGRE